jgi:hypothetical protein
MALRNRWPPATRFGAEILYEEVNEVDPPLTDRGQDLRPDLPRQVVDRVHGTSPRNWVAV